MTAFAGSAVAVVGPAATESARRRSVRFRGASSLSAASHCLSARRSAGFVRRKLAIATSSAIFRSYSPAFASIEHATPTPRASPLNRPAAASPTFGIGPNVLDEAEIVLVSRASTEILGVDPDRLVGPFSSWLEIVHPDDRDIVVAASPSSSFERKAVTCEYRIAPNESPASAEAGSTRLFRLGARDVAPHYTSDDQLDGWDGVVEEITEQRALQQENRRIAGMLQALVANMPTGVFFVQGPVGQPILVNSRSPAASRPA